MTSDPNRRSPLRRDRDDEWIAIVVAFGVLGAAVAWPWLQSSPPGIGNIAEPPAATNTEPAAESSPQSAISPDSSLDNPDPGAELGSQLYDTLQRPIAAPQDSNRGRDDGSSRATPRQSEDRDQTADNRAAANFPASPGPSLAVPQPQIPNPEGTAATPLTPPLPDPLAFSDLPADHWAKPYIDGLTARGILSGFPDGTFNPDQPMTRAQFAAQLAQAFDQMPAQRSPSDFQDLGTDNWAYDGVSQAVSLGFMEGYPGNVFQPDQTVPRVQVMAALVAGLNIQPPGDINTVLQNHPDQGEIPTWARSQTAAAIAAQLISTEGNTRLTPNRPATRAEVAAMLYQSLVYLGEVPPLEE
jgi:hypothetical protein